MKVFRTAAFLLISTLLVSVSCRKDDKDLSPPTVKIYSPEMNEEFEAGGVLEFHALFEDDVELGEYHIDIHENFDGHSHRGDYDTWTVDKTFSLSGDREEVKETFQIPEKAEPGDYHFTLRFTDKAGNAGGKNGATSYTLDIVVLGE